MSWSDLSLLSKIAIGFAIAGFVVSFSTSYSTSVNGVATCDYTDYGKIVMGGLAVMIGGMGEVAALGKPETRIPNLLASGGASLVGVLHLLMGFGVIGGPC